MLVVIDMQRPERIGRRQLALVEMQHVVLVRIELATLGVRHGHRVQHIFRRGRAQARVGNGGTARIVGAIGADARQHGIPVIDRRAQARHPIRDATARHRLRVGQRLFHGRAQAPVRERLTAIQADAAHAVKNRRVVGVRRVVAHHVKEQREERGRVHAGRLFGGRAVGHRHRHRHGQAAADGGRTHARAGLRIDVAGVAVARRRGRGHRRHHRRCRHACLDLIDGGIVLRALGLRPADQPTRGGGAVDDVDARGHAALPVGADDGERLRAGSVGAGAARGEHVAPHIQRRQHRVAAAGIRQVHDQGRLRHVEPQAGVQRVGAGPRGVGGARIRESGLVAELVDRRAAIQGRLHGGGLAARQFHQHHRVGVDVGVDRRVAQFLFAHLRGGRGRRRIRRFRDQPQRGLRRLSLGGGHGAGAQGTGEHRGGPPAASNKCTHARLLLDFVC
ncbi:hypothetical protein D3C71_1203370 [compost metagenome]